MFVFHYWDGVITVLIGFVACCAAFLRRPTQRDLLDPKQVRHIRRTRIAVALILAIALLFFGYSGPPAPKWRRVLTPDGIASAEFPYSPRTSEIAGMPSGSTVITWNCPFKDFSMSLSTSLIPPEQQGITIFQRIEFVRAS